MRHCSLFQVAELSLNATQSVLVTQYGAQAINIQFWTFDITHDWKTKVWNKHVNMATDFKSGCYKIHKIHFWLKFHTLTVYVNSYISENNSFISESGQVHYLQKEHLDCKRNLYDKMVYLKRHILSLHVGFFCLHSLWFSRVKVQYKFTGEYIGVGRGGARGGQAPQ